MRGSNPRKRATSASFCPAFDSNVKKVPNARVQGLDLGETSFGDSPFRSGGGRSTEPSRLRGFCITESRLMFSPHVCSALIAFDVREIFRKISQNFSPAGVTSPFAARAMPTAWTSIVPVSGR